MGATASLIIADVRSDCGSLRETIVSDIRQRAVAKVALSALLRQHQQLNFIEFCPLETAFHFNDQLRTVKCGNKDTPLQREQQYRGSFWRVSVERLKGNDLGGGYSAEEPDQERVEG